MNFPRDKNQYVLAAATADDGTTVHKAKHVDPATGEEVAVGIKIFDIYKIEDIYSFTTQLHKAEKFDHENIVKVHRSFMTEDRLWVVMSPPGTPTRSILRSYFRQGMPEKAVAFILRETLKAMHYMHEKKEACENMGAGCVCLDDECRVKVGISLISYDDRSNDVKMDSVGDGKSKANDVLMLGFLALELFYGEVPSSDEFSSLMAGEIGDRSLRHFRIFSCFRGEGRKRIPAALAEVVAACLSRDPEARPTTSQLMGFRFFQKRFSGNRSLQKIMNNKR